MIYFKAFLICGLICAIGEIILEYTKLTPGHVNTLLAVSGAVLSFLGIYECLLDYAGAGASVPITNFGHLIFKGAYEGFQKDGITGLLDGVFSTSSGGLTVTIIIGFLVALVSKPKH